MIRGESILAPVPAPLRLGEYELLCELGSGGMATLYVARHVGAADVERLVAVKRVHRHVLAVPGIQDMFRDEARLAALVRHPNVVRVLEVAEIEGELLIVLDYVESVSLAALEHAARAAGERVPVPIVARVLADALAGLHAAHEATDPRGEPLGIVHRDFSPQNVLVGVDGISQLIDFGVAKAAVRATQTQSGVLKGKFQYMSPEQARGDANVDRRSDMFAAGIVLFEALTGTLPFGAEAADPSAILLRIMLDPVPPPTSLVPGLPAALDTIIERALERVRDERYQTAAEMREALVEAVPPASEIEVQAVLDRWCHASLAKRRDEIRRALAGTAPTATRAEPNSMGTAPTVAATPSARQRGRLVRIAVAAAAITAVLAILGIGIFAGLHWRSPEAERQVARDASPPVVAVQSADAAPPAPDAAIAAPKHAVHAQTHPTVPPPPAKPSPGVRPGFTADGALLLHGHQIRAHARLVSNTTALPDANLVHALDDLGGFVLVEYRLATAAMPDKDPLPRGTVTATYELRSGAFMPPPTKESTLGDETTSERVAEGLLAALGRAMKAGPPQPTGRIVLAVTIDVQ